MTDIVDQHPYDDEDLLPIELQIGEAGVMVRTIETIPHVDAIKGMLSGGAMVAFGLDRNWSTEGGISGILHHPELASGDSPVEMRWMGDDYTEIFLMSEFSAEPSEGDTFLASFLGAVLEKALFQIARDARGYPLILSSTDVVMVEWIMLRAWRLQAGGEIHGRIIRSLGSPNWLSGHFAIQS